MKTTYDLACAMEDGLDSVEKLARALMMMVENLGEDAGPIEEIARLIRDHARRLETRRNELCRLLHPDRRYFETAGWRGGAGNDKAA
jgi:hypothetical protein